MSSLPASVHQDDGQYRRAGFACQRCVVPMRGVGVGTTVWFIPGLGALLVIVVGSHLRASGVMARRRARTSSRVASDQR